MSQRSPYSIAYGLKSIPFQVTGQSMDPKYRVILPESARSLLDEMGKILELGQTELIIVRGVVGSGKTRLLTELCRLMIMKNFGTLESAADSQVRERLTSLRMRSGFGFNVELDRLSIVAFEKRFHDAIFEFLPYENRGKFNLMYSQRRSQIRRQYASETTRARKMISEMVDILKSRFRYEYFLICIDEFDIILPEHQAGPQGDRDTVEFLNGLNEISKDLSNKQLPVLIALLQTHYANKYFHDYLKRMSDATGSRIVTRFDVTLGYNYDETRRFVISRLAPERIEKPSDILAPFSEGILKVLYEQFEDKGERKILSLRNIEQSLLKLLQLGLKNGGKITVEMAQQVAAESSSELAETPVFAVPPEIIQQARADLARLPVDKVSRLMKATEDFLSKANILKNKFADLAEEVEVSDNLAITRTFYEIVHANNRFDVAMIYCLFRTDTPTDIQKIVDSTMQSKPHPQRIFVLAHSPIGLPREISNALLIPIRTNDLEVIFAASHMVDIPEEIARQVNFILGKISSSVAEIRDIPKAVSIPTYCLNTLASVAISFARSPSTAESIKDNLLTICGTSYERKLSEYLSRLRDWGLVLADGTACRPTIPTSLQRLLSISEGQSVPRDELKETFPEKRFDNLESIALQLGLFTREDGTLTRRNADFWRTKFSENIEAIDKTGALDEPKLAAARRLAELSDSARTPWQQVPIKYAFDLTNEVIGSVQSLQQSKNEIISRLTELQQATVTVEAPNHYVHEFKSKLLQDIEAARKSPETTQSKIDELKENYQSLLNLATKKGGGELTSTNDGAIAQLGEVIGVAPLSKERTYGPVEKKILDVLSSSPKSWPELTAQLSEYSEDVVKAVTIDLIEKDEIRLIKRRYDAE